jgi:hypothetical protein
MQEFPNFLKITILKNTIFSKFSKNFSFYLRDLHQKKMYKETQKNGLMESQNPRF